MNPWEQRMRVAVDSPKLSDLVRADFRSWLQEIDALRKTAELWGKALSAYERGVLMSHDGRTGERDGYITLFLEALRERNLMRERNGPEPLAWWWDI